MQVTTAYQVEFGKRVARLDTDSLTFEKYRKTALAEAVQIDHDFAVETLEGVMEGRAGDYLMRGAAGELYPCAKEIFESTYEGAGLTNDTGRECIGLDLTSEYGGYAKVLLAPEDIQQVVDALLDARDKHLASVQA